MSTQDAERMAALLSDALDEMRSRSEQLQSVHTALVSQGVLSRVTLRKYMCPRGCQIATAFKVGDLVLCAVRDYKLSPGLNIRDSVPSARTKRTLDGDRHWPSHVYDVSDLSTPSVGVGVPMNCRHVRGSRPAVQIMADVAGTTPGKPGMPIRI